MSEEELANGIMSFVSSASSKLGVLVIAIVVILLFRVTILELFKNRNVLKSIKDDFSAAKRGFRKYILKKDDRAKEEAMQKEEEGERCKETTPDTRDEKTD